MIFPKRCENVLCVCWGNSPKTLQEDYIFAEKNMVTEHLNNIFKTLCGSVTNVFRRLRKHSIKKKSKLLFDFSKTLRKSYVYAEKNT